MKKIRINIAAILILLTNIFCFGNDYNIKYISAEQGLSQNGVTAILQDQYGFMWFGTRSGMNRFDGYEFLQLKLKAIGENYISNSSIECLYKDHEDNIWIGTTSDGLNFYNPKDESINPIKYFGKNKQGVNEIRLTKIVERQNGDIIVGTRLNGLLILDKQNDTLLSLLDNSRIFALTIDEDTAWIGTDAGLFKMDLNTYKYEHVDLGHQITPTEIVVDKDDKHLWIVGWTGALTKLNKNTLSWNRYSLNEKDTAFISNQNSTYSLLQDSKGNLWIGTWGSGLYYFDVESSTFTNFEIIPNYLRGFRSDFDVILDIFEDNNKNIWIGTDGGGLVLIGTKKTFNGISLPNDIDCGLKNFHITCLYETKDGSFWLGTNGGGLYRTRNKKTFEYIPTLVKSGETNIIQNIYEVSENLLWVSTGTETFELDISNKNLKLTPGTDKNVFSIGKIVAILRLGDDMIIGTQEDGLHIISGYYLGKRDDWKISPQNDSIFESVRVTFIKKDIDNTIWIGTYKGIYIYDNIKKSVSVPKFSDDKKLSSNIFLCWAQTSDGSIWLGTPSGLNKLTKQSGKYQINQYSEETGLTDININSILSENGNNIWISTNAGLSRMNIHNNKVTSFTKSDGLQGSNYSPNAAYKSADGTFYFGGFNGFNYFKPSEITVDSSITPVVFTGFKILSKGIKPGEKVNGNIIMNQPINFNPKINLTHRENEFTIEFAALNYNSPENNQYKYKLEGYDMEWIVAGQKRNATYTNLNAGDYEFKVQGSKNGLFWNEQAANLRLHIKPAPWRTWYALVFYILLGFGLVLLAIWNTVKQERLAKNVELMKMKVEQEKNLNEMKLRFFTNVSHEFRTPLTLIIAIIKELLNRTKELGIQEDISRKMLIVNNNAQRLVELVNQLVVFRKTESCNLKLKAGFSDLSAFIYELGMSFKELADVNHINFEIIDKLPQHSVACFDKFKLEIVVNNLLSNAFKFVQDNGQIVLLLSKDNDWFYIKVKDNGVGIPENEKDEIFDRFYQSDNQSKNEGGIGLELSKRLVVLHGGKISVESIPWKETVFTVQLPCKTQTESPYQPAQIVAEVSNINSLISKNKIIKSVKQVINKNVTKSEKIILIVEDNLDIRNYLINYLNNYYQTLFATNGEEGLEMAISKIPDLIISDVMMPKMDGFELCERIKSHKQTSHIPLILLTAKSDEYTMLAGIKKGADAFIPKPFNPEYLLEKIIQILNTRKEWADKYSKKIKLGPKDIEITPQEEKLLNKAVEIIEKNIDNSEFNARHLALQMGMSPSTLNRQLKLITEHSPASLIRTIRMKRAAQLIKKTDQTISEISFNVGYLDTKNFRNSFYKEFGLSPSHYKKNQ